MTPISPPADLRPLTSLRFFAALWVILYAFWENLAVGFQPNLVAKGYLGVELFFVLSGFILSHVYLEAAGEKRFSYSGFLWARIARVYPLHLATLFGVMALGVAASVAGMNIDSGVMAWSSLPANLIMVHAWGLAPEAGWNHPSWSISAEWFAYLLFPVFAAVAWRLRRWPVATAFAAAGFLVGLYLIFEGLAGFPLTQATIHWGALRIVPCFALGCALYLIHRRRALPQPGLIAVASAAAMLGSAVLLAFDGVIVIFAGLLILALASLPNERAGWLASRPAVYLGEISYSVYMVCVPWKLLAVTLAAKALNLPDKQLPPLVWLVLVLGTVGVAAVSYHLVEKPARTALRAWASRRGERQAAAKHRAQLA